MKRLLVYIVLALSLLLIAASGFSGGGSVHPESKPKEVADPL